MAYRQDSFAVGEYYHLYSRGVDKRKIFLNAQDYRKFLFLLYVCNSEKSIVLRDIGENFERGETLVDIGAYCLMPNHFHLLVRERVDGGISRYMRKVLTSYSMYFNLKNQRQGKLFDSPFKSSWVGSDKYLKYMYSYIHLNPAKLIDKDWRKFIYNKGSLMDYCFSYNNSSISEYRTKKYKILNPIQFPEYFANRSDHKEELKGWLEFTP